MKYFKVCRVRCRKCGDVLEYVNKIKLSRGMLRYCSCGAVGLDPATVMYRILGNPEDYEDMSEEWNDVVEQVAATIGFPLDEEDKARIRRDPENSVAELVKEHTVDLKLYEEAMAEHKKNPITYTHKEVLDDE